MDCINIQGRHKDRHKENHTGKIGIPENTRKYPKKPEKDVTRCNEV